MLLFFLRWLKGFVEFESADGKDFTVELKQKNHEFRHGANIFLIGDSIRFGAPPDSPGYGVYVKEALSARANVYAPDENCRMAQYTLRYIRMNLLPHVMFM